MKRTVTRYGIVYTPETEAEVRKVNEERKLKMGDKYKPYVLAPKKPKVCDCPCHYNVNVMHCFPCC